MQTLLVCEFKRRFRNRSAPDNSAYIVPQALGGGPPAGSREEFPETIMVPKAASRLRVHQWIDLLQVKYDEHHGRSTVFSVDFHPTNAFYFIAGAVD